MKITTNNQARDIVYKYELTDAEREDFDYLDDSAEFVRYRGDLIPLNDFVRIVRRANATGFAMGVDDDSPLLAWDAIHTDTFFSGTVIRFCGDSSRVIGRAYG